MFAKKLASILAICACAVLSACASLAPVETVPVASGPAPVLILVSIDAFRADYYDRGLTPNLKALADGGAHAVMHPSFPSLTYPNHYTLVTGLLPDHHGVVANYMYDPTHPADAADPDFVHFNKTKNGDGFWWNGAKPVWVSAENAGKKVGIVYWPGSEAEIRHVRPSYWLPFSKAATSDDRVTSLLAMMDQPEAQRPQVYLLYLDIVDEKGHKKGPDSPELNAALVEVDTAVGRLRSELKQRGVTANIVIVSDHGMTNAPPQQATYISDVLGRSKLAPDAKVDPRYEVITWGPTIMLNPAPGYEALLDKALIRTHHDHMRCWHKADIPPRLKFGKNPRVPEIVCAASLGWQVGGVGPVSADVGNHGYDPAYPDMNAIFIANGPDIKPGVELPVFDNVDVYDLEMYLLRLPPEPNDGTLRPIRPALK